MGDVSYSNSMETWETKSVRQIVANDLDFSFNVFLKQKSSQYITKIGINEIMETRITNQLFLPNF